MDAVNQRYGFGPRKPQLRTSPGERLFMALCVVLAICGITLTIWAVVTGHAPWWILLLK